MILGQRGRNTSPSGQWSRISTAQTLATSTATPIVMDTTTSDPYGILGSPASELVIPKGWGGLWLISAGVRFTGLGGGDATRRYSWFDINAGGSVFYEQAQLNWNSATLSLPLAVTGMFRLNVGDFIQVIARQDSGGNLTAVASPVAMAWVCP